MKKSLTNLVFTLFTLASIAQIPNGYYDDAQGLSGEQLKTALFNIIDNHDVQSYSYIWISFESTDPKPNGKVWDMYSDVPGGTPPYEYNFGDDQCGNYSGEGDCYNREHSFPKSWFNDASPMYSDLFQIVPTDGYVNGQRSNWPYGEVNSASWTSQNGSKVGSNSTSGYSGTVFEPIDEYKGDFARIYFYMATRYEEQIASWENNSSNSDAALDGTSYPCYEEWYLNLLLDWHQNDPVSQKEIDRNNEIYDIQDNRNPYVDHPEYVNQVWGGVMAPVITNVNWLPNSPDESEAVTVSANITDDGSISSAVLKYGFSAANLNQNLNMSASGNNYTATIPGQNAGQMVYFQITATDNESNTSLSAVFDYQVNENAGTIALPFFEDFNDETLGIFLEYSVSGADQYWQNDDYNTEYYAKMSNFNGSENIANEDWMITPAINFNDYNNEMMNFRSSMMDYNDNQTFIYLKYASNYSGSGNPNNASWTDISSQADWSQGDYEWTESGQIDLSNINGTSVHLAFVYVSDAGSGKTWQIDDVSITIDETTNEAPEISNVNYSPQIPDENETVAVTATITDDDLVSSAIVLWGLSEGNMSNIENMSASGNNYSASIPGQNAGATIFFMIQAFDNEGEMSETTVYQYTIESPLPVQMLPFLETFESDDLGIFNSYSVVGDNEWHNDVYNGNHYAKMSNYDGSENLENEDWLLTNAINFNNYSNEVLNFESAMMDYDDNSTFIYLKYSTNYNGVSDPNTADWIDLSSQAEWSNGDYEWTESGDIDLSGISGTAVYLAFVYESEDGSGKTWEIDHVSVSLEGANEAPIISNISQNPMEPDHNDDVTISAIITDDNEVEVAEIQYGFSAGLMDEIVDMVASGNSFTGVIPAQEANQFVYYRMMAIDDEGATAYSAIRNYYVALAQGVERAPEGREIIYPNPASHSFRIQTFDTKNGALQILHSSGKLVMQISDFASDQQIDISDLASGSYLVRLINKEEALIFNLIVQ